ncbi:MAG TPA: prolyl oligopeptidase family serine peptidase, partial [Steroidobacteraceae bacterium]|nr:prolyl oligopeptidase family serine peptidase [Steroidobacteraceae bacterium]
GIEPRWLELPDALQPVWGLGLSADGRRVFVDSSDFLIKERTIYLYDVATGHREIFFQSRDATRVLPSWSAAWAPDDEGLIVLSDDDGFFHLYHVREARGAPRRLTGGEWEVASFEVDAWRRSIHFVANEAHRAELQLYRVPLAGGKLERLSRAAGTHAPVYSPDFRHAADRFSSDTTPPDLYLADLRSGAAARRITTSPRPEFAQLRLAKISYVQFESHVDGTLVHGRLSLPSDFDPERRYPLLIGSLYRNTVRNRWGGGNEIPTWGLDQHLSDRGYVLMKVDTRGSWGSGSAARRAVHHDFGGIDIEDVESGVRYMMTQGYVEPGRVGIWGWSYGGLMTLMSLFKKPDLYAAGIADAPASNVAHAFPRQMWVMGRPEGADFPQRYERMSALNFTAGLTKPLMITHANKDDIVLYGDTIALGERLIAEGKTFELVTLPGSSHIWARDSLAQQRFGYVKMAEFFDRYLQAGRHAAP